MTPRIGEMRMPIPIRDPEREALAKANGPVVTYTLPPEEIERIFGKGKPSQGKGSMAEFVKSPGEAKRKTEKWMRQLPVKITGQIGPVEREEPKKPGRKERPAPLAKDELLRRVADGATLAGIERELGMKSNTIFYWLRKWGLIGINPGKARELLAGLGDRGGRDQDHV